MTARESCHVQWLKSDFFRRIRQSEHFFFKFRTVHSPLFFREIVDVDRSVRPGCHLGLLMRAKLGREQNGLG